MKKPDKTTTLNFDTWYPKLFTMGNTDIRNREEEEKVVLGLIKKVKEIILK